MNENQVWYYLDPKEEDQEKARKGPLSERDIDVMLRTCEFNSGILVQQDGDQEWLPLFKQPALKNCLQQQSFEIFQMQNQQFEPKVEPVLEDGQESEQKEESNDIIEDQLNLNDEEKLEILKKKLEKNRKKAKKEKEKKKEKWYQPKINTNIYVSGLPEDITEDEMKDFFIKAGVIRIDPATLKPKIKIYKGENGKCKGDGLVSYKMYESVQIAKDVLNEKEIKPGFRLTVMEAEFQQKGEYKKREKKQIDKLNQKVAKQKELKDLRWEENAEEGLKIVIMEGLFTAEDGLNEEYMKELEGDVKTELEESVGEISKMEIFKSHPDGLNLGSILKVKFKSAYDADQCISIMDNRYYNGNQIKCYYWDGKTDYKRSKESENEEQKRLEEFSKWIES